jgi:trafficking protein particle complex subunit 5
MISDNDPLISKYISVPKELSELNCNYFLAGIVEAILDGAQFVSQFLWLILILKKIKIK